MGRDNKVCFFFEERNLKEEELIEECEKLNITSDVHFDVLSDKKAELEKIRQIKFKGEQIRSRVHWLDQGEKPTKYFCNLENKNYIEKTIQNIQLDNGSFITNQNQILHQIKKYYQNLFKDKDHTLDNVDLQEVFKNIPYKKVSDTGLSNPITLCELSTVLKTMKHNKTPAIDGITSEFLKVFWVRLKYFVVNTAFEKQCLSTSLRQCIITCLPKGKKDRRFLKNW